MSCLPIFDGQLKGSISRRTLTVVIYTSGYTRTNKIYTSIMMVNVVTEILAVYKEPYSNCLHTIHIFLPYKEYQLYKSRT